MSSDDPTIPGRDVRLLSLSPRSLIVALIAMAIIACLGIMALAGFNLARSHEQYQRQAETTAQSLCAVLSDDTILVYEKIDLALWAVKEELERQLQGGHVDKARLESFIRREREKVPVLFTLRTVDAAGLVEFGNDVSPGKPVSLADRDYFKRLQADPRAGLVFSKPLLGRVNNRWGIMIARRIDWPDGSFRGIVYGSVELLRLQEHFAAFSVGRDGIISLRDADLVLLARSTGGPDVTGQANVSPRLREIVRWGQNEGIYRAVSGQDQVDRIYAFRRLQPYGQYLHVGLGAREVFEPWRREALQTGIFLGVFLATVATLGGFALRALQRLAAADREVRSINADLTEANRELEAAREAAEAANRAKSLFLANMSHELRTPLNAILGFAQIMRRSRELAEGERNNLERIFRAGEHLLGLINEVLSIAKIEAGKFSLNPAPFFITDLVLEVREIIAVRAAEKSLAFEVQSEFSSGEAFLGDAGKLRQVLINLLGNAVKFTAAGRVGLRVARGDTGLRFEVWDTGPGLSPGEREVLFQAFSQAEAGVKAQEGTGLGLYLSQAMVRLMGGEILAEDREGRGVCFSFSLPLPIADALPGTVLRRRLERLQPGQTALKTLVVDDRPDNREVLARLLSLWGFQVRTAEDGLQALETWEAWAPDVVWMDLVMPRMGGVETTGRIRARERTLGRKPTLVLALSASVLDTDQEAILAQGFDAYAVKPFREAEIADILERKGGYRFMEQEEDLRSAQGPSSTEGLSGLPAPWVTAFREALLMGDQEAALQRLQELGDCVLARDLRMMVKAYRFVELLGSLEEAGSVGSASE